MIYIDDITQRLWYLYLVNEGIFLFSFSGNDRVGFNIVLPGYKNRYVCKDIPSLYNTNLVPPKVKHLLGFNENESDPLFNKCRGVVFSNPNDLLKLLTEWNYFSIKRSLFPMLVYSRETLNTVKMNCVVSNMCVDANFLQSELPNSEYMYRNQATLANALSVPAPVLPKGLVGLWEDWLQARNIFAYSKKYYCAAFYGYPTKLNLLRGKNLFKDPKDKDMVKYLLFYTLVMNKFDIEKLQDIGFVWNRYNQVWAGAAGAVDESELRVFIDGDNMATPDNMGFVPEWYARLDIAKHATTRESGGDRFDNSVLWKQFWF